MKRRDPSLKFDEDSHKVKNTRLSPKAVLLNYYILHKQDEGNIPRADGQLAMTRAFGDRKLKEHITSEPDITVKKIDAETDFIILASDGLWKVMSNQEAYDCIEELDDAQEAAEELIKEALSRKS